jgi:uncharacterized membrane protein YqjE
MTNKIKRSIPLEKIKRYKFFLPIVLFPLWLQIHLEITLTPLFGALYQIMVPYFAVGFLILSIIFIIFRTIRQRSAVKALYLLVVPVYIFTAIYCGEIWTEKQYSQNKINGTKLAHALEEYHKDKGQWPEDISVLKNSYLTNYPKWRYGFISKKYIYWLDDYSKKPMLKFPKGAWTGVFYSFQERKWRDSTL